MKTENKILTLGFLLIAFCVLLIVLLVTGRKDGSDYQIYKHGSDTLVIKEGDKVKGKMFFTDDSELGYILQHGQN